MVEEVVEEEEEGVEVGSTRCRFLEEPIVIFCLFGEGEREGGREEDKDFVTGFYLYRDCGNGGMHVEWTGG
ncbi:hypothetical protein CFP56_021568 [Quercus suber]|uniref:Uncharacterized protein n=1 Tax=Quercus suber TaxID=58331 RepID=A0AAW0M0V3_QUESU